MSRIDAGRVPAAPGSHELSPNGLSPSGFDPSRGGSCAELSVWLGQVARQEWIWARNSRCKYVTLKTDTRRGAYAILDRDDNPIELDDLFRQGGRDSDTHRMAETGTGSGRSLSSAGRKASPNIQRETPHD